MSALLYAFLELVVWIFNRRCILSRTCRCDLIILANLRQMRVDWCKALRIVNHNCMNFRCCELGLELVCEGGIFLFCHENLVEVLFADRTSTRSAPMEAKHGEFLLQVEVLIST